MKNQTKKTENQPTEKKAKNPKRELLIAYSATAKEIRQNKIDDSTTAKEGLFWASRSVNYMLLNHVYDTQGATEFNTFNQWKERGATIIKGSQSFAVWGQPVNKQNLKESEANDQESEYEFFPMCHLFSDKQVILSAEEKEEMETESQTENL